MGWLRGQNTAAKITTTITAAIAYKRRLSPKKSIATSRIWHPYTIGMPRAAYILGWMGIKLVTQRGRRRVLHNVLFVRHTYAGSSILPKRFEPLRRQLGVAHRVRDVPVPQVLLN